MGRLVQICLVLSVALAASAQKAKPNVLFVMADDMGWDDWSSHGSRQVLTPNLDSLAGSGVLLHRYYTHALCSPARSAVLTGRYSHTIGMQGRPLLHGEARGIPTTERLLPQYLKELGYRTQLVGKWHVGHAYRNQLPINRGFENHYGARTGFMDYYEYNSQEAWATGPVSGLSLFRDYKPDFEAEGYITDLYNEEAKHIIRSHNTSEPLFLMVTHHAPHNGNEDASLQAPPEEVRAQRHVELHPRRIFAAMVKKLDDSVGDMVATLKEQGMLENTIIVFVADNGAPTVGNGANSGSNYPLRGVKGSPWEGGIRVDGLVWAGPEVAEGNDWRGNIFQGKMHASDWLPTLLEAIGEKPPAGIDGIPQWKHILENQPTRQEIFEIDDFTGYSSITLGRHKLIVGTVNAAYNLHRGGDLRGIIGQPPNYQQAVLNSKAYAAITAAGVPIDVERLEENKEKATVTCGEGVAKECIPTADKWCLYDIIDDPCEYRDLSDSLPGLAEVLRFRLAQEEERVVPRTDKNDPIGSERAMPKNFNYTWETFMDLEPYTA
ncbi:hypothetical protein JYU34_022638 [Plutella xylostella]|uniref:Sulfatase N-terminal domain-containing protein n=1 Tax=Plutella xylostella TaxID=51655 RepID=A0ABQ7PPY1_PLUXY|nr:arylsulfatase B isoform X1 [Plutella xylostella]KAG7294858.1 hypothetical protein JYU34_022762 [Plutella xylostella]KAG7294965.1 hypothetical protein JYU34_022638 [Plutella xylostella]